jgi:hypothetical protein
MPEMEEISAYFLLNVYLFQEGKRGERGYCQAISTFETVDDDLDTPLIDM